MAIPFVLPTEEDHGRSEVELEHLLSELIDINQQIQILLRARMQQRASTHTSQRVCPSRHHQRNQQTIAMQSSVLPDLVRSSLPATIIAAADAPLTVRHHQRGHHQHSREAEAACCYHAKITTHMLGQDQPLIAAAGTDGDVDWKQAAERLPFMVPALLSPSSAPPSPAAAYLVVPAAADDDEDKSSLLAKIIPATTSSRSLWTAVLCVVGWQLFRAR